MISEKELSDAIVTWSDTLSLQKELRSKLRECKEKRRNCEDVFGTYLETTDEDSIDLGEGREYTSITKQKCCLTRKVYKEHMGEQEHQTLVNKHTHHTSEFGVKKRKRSE